MLTGAIIFLGICILVLAIMLAPWAVNEYDKIEDGDEHTEEDSPSGNK